MSDEKVYYPAEITDNPLPLEVTGESMGVTSDSTKAVSTAAKITDNPLPRKKIAVELISDRLNTKSKKIMAEFQFTPSGAIRIGEYVYGVSGEIDLSPIGIIAKNDNGDITFALDGQTGEAVFKGEVRAADFVVSDSNGLVSLSNFKNGTVSASDQQQTTSTSYVDLDSMVLVTPNLTRETVVLILFTAQNQIYSTNPVVAGDWSNNFIVEVDGVENSAMYMVKESSSGGAAYQTDGIGFTTNTMHYLSTLSAGQHTIKIKWKVNNFSGVGIATAFRRTLSFSSFGG